MNRLLNIFTLIALLFFSLACSQPQRVVMGYLAVRDTKCIDKIQTLDWSILTHVLPSFCWVMDDASVDFSDVDRILPALKGSARTNKVKLIASFKSGKKGNFKNAISDEAKRELLASNICDYVISRSFDGVDIDYEDYPMSDTDLTNLLDLFERLRSKLGRNHQMICAINGSDWIDYGREWHTYFDYINVMIYDYGMFSSTPVQHASMELFKNQINRCVENFDIPREKIVGGIPLYGYSWKNGVSQPKAVPFSRIIDDSKGSADVLEGEYVDSTYYNGRSIIREKCQYIKENGFAGVMVWQLAHDSFNPSEKLMSAINDSFK